jgi:hypothetical protein
MLTNAADIMTLTGTTDDFCSISSDSDITLRGVEDTYFWKLSDTRLEREDLNPGEAKWFMKQEKKYWLKCYPVVFDTNSDTPIIASELFETDRSR